MSKGQISILLVGSSTSHVSLIQENLVTMPTRFDVCCVQRFPEAFGLVGKGDVDAVLLDLENSQSRDLDVLARIASITPDAAVVVLVGIDGRNSLLRA